MTTDTTRRILVVDDDAETCRLIAELIQAPERDIRFAHDARSAVAASRQAPFDLLVSDINLNSEESGLDVLKAFKAANPLGEVVLISGFGTLETAVQAVRAGAFDYISKPFNIAAVQGTVDRALAKAAAGPPVRTHLDAAPPEGMIGHTAGMLEVYKQIAYAADSSVPVLVVGESGTGKELVARAIHTHSARTRLPFVAINCGALAETLLDSELFGHVRGSFTGAVSDHKGVFEQARGGTVFLDEVDETPASMQVKLLRVIQEGEVRQVGGSRPIHVEARIVAATNADLDERVTARAFRQDLYYRLSVVTIRLPPLRERREDIPMLVDQFLRAASARASRSTSITPAALDLLTRHSWPGNVRELENTIERLVVFTRGVIGVPDLPATIGQGPSTEARLFDDLPTLDELERRYLVHVLKAVGGNKSRAAQALGIDRRTLYRMAERFGMDLKDDPATPNG